MTRAMAIGLMVVGVLVFSVSTGFIIRACSNPWRGVHAFEQRVFELSNYARASVGLEPFIWHGALARVARAHSNDMNQNNFMSHTGSDGSSVSERITRAGITFRGAGENVARNQRTPEAVVRGWLDSTGHRANIFNANLTHLSVGFAEGPNGTFWTQKFLRV